jgi:hypothetical protein
VRIPRSKIEALGQSTVFFHFLQTEVTTGKVFASIALQSKSREKMARNRSHARLAHDTALRFLDRIPLSSMELRDIQAGLAELKADLARLGEPF